MRLSEVHRSHYAAVAGLTCKVVQFTYFEGSTRNMQRGMKENFRQTCSLHMKALLVVTSATLVVTGATLVVTMFLFSIFSTVTTSVAPVTTSVALVSNSKHCYY